jgi:hypothetical protein
MVEEDLEDEDDLVCQIFTIVFDKEIISYQNIIIIQNFNVPEFESDPETTNKDRVVGIIKKPRNENETRGPRRGVTFDPLALLLDASLEGELDLVKRTAREVHHYFAENNIHVYVNVTINCCRYLILPLLTMKESLLFTTPSVQVTLILLSSLSSLGVT